MYINPYKFFNLSSTCSEAELLANKTELLSAISLYKNKDKVYIGANQLSHKDATRLVDDLNDPSIMYFHKLIFDNKKLLNFLEYGHLNYFRSEQKTTIPEDTDFLKFIAPFFGHQYGETLLQAIKTQDKETLTLLSSTSLPMSSDFENECYKHANLYVENTILELKELQNKQELLHMSERELLSYLPNRTIELYNMLPDYFASARNLIGNEVYQLSVVLTQNYGRADGAYAMLTQGLKLKLDDTVRTSLESMLNSFNLRSKVPSFILIAIVFIAVLFLMKYIENNFL